MIIVIIIIKLSFVILKWLLIYLNNTANLLKLNMKMLLLFSNIKLSYVMHTFTLSAVHRKHSNLINILSRIIGFHVIKSPSPYWLRYYPLRADWPAAIVAVNRDGRCWNRHLTITNTERICTLCHMYIRATFFNWLIIVIYNYHLYFCVTIIYYKAR